MPFGGQDREVFVRHAALRIYYGISTLGVSLRRAGAREVRRPAR